MYIMFKTLQISWVEIEECIYFCYKISNAQGRSEECIYFCYKVSNKMYGLRSNTDAQSNAELVKKINNLNDSTSYFNIKDIFALRLDYNDVNDIKEFTAKITQGRRVNEEKFTVEGTSALYIGNREYHTFSGCSTINYESISSLSDDEKQFATLLDQVVLNEEVVRGTNESKTDTFIDYILREVGLGKYPLAIRLKPVYVFKVRHKTISSEYDFSVEKKGKLLMVEEDKHIKNTGPGSAWGEYQLAGEMIAGAFENYRKFATSSEIFSVRAIGPRFTFYHVIIPTTYLASLDKGLPEETITISRYPPQNHIPPGLDYKKLSDREVIIDLLMKIKQTMIS